MSVGLMERAEETLALMRKQPMLWTAVRAEVDAFFAAHPAEDDAAARDIMTVIVFERMMGKAEVAA